MVKFARKPVLHGWTHLVFIELKSILESSTSKKLRLFMKVCMSIALGVGLHLKIKKFWIAHLIVLPAG